MYVYMYMYVDLIYRNYAQPGPNRMIVVQDSFTRGRTVKVIHMYKIYHLYTETARPHTAINVHILLVHVHIHASTTWLGQPE